MPSSEITTILIAFITAVVGPIVVYYLTNRRYEKLKTLTEKLKRDLNDAKKALRGTNEPSAEDCGIRTVPSTPAMQSIGDAGKFSHADVTKPAVNIRLVKKDEFAHILQDRLADSKVQTVRIITYTSEVDAGLLRDYHIKGQKTIEIFKRSILSDLAEEQEYNVQMIAEGPFTRAWKKRKKSIDTSESIDKNTPAGSRITQYLYDAPPSKRAYMFDQNEAIIGFYEVLDKANLEHKSLYAGMTDTYALHVQHGTPLGDYLLDELDNYIAGLRRQNHLWEDEKRILRNQELMKRNGRSPCIEPRAVFLDLDGVLYDSMPLYVIAWQEAFASVGVDFPKEKVYLEEGADGREMIRLHLKEMKFPNISDEITESIYSKNVETLKELLPPKPMEGATDLLRVIVKSGVRVLVVTGSTNPEHVRRVSRDFDLVSESDVITVKDIRAGKPDPDPYLLACHITKVQPCQAIVIENAPLGIKSADIAGTFCIAVNTGPLGISKLKAAGARAVFDSCSRLAEHWDEILDVLRE